GRSPQQRRQPAGDSDGGPVLCRGRSHGRQALGYLQPVRAAGSGAQREEGLMDKAISPDAARTAKPYHHGDLRNGLLDAARSILEEEDLSQLTLRAVARKAGVSHAAPYRHFPNHEALLVELSLE